MTIYFLFAERKCYRALTNVEHFDPLRKYRTVSVKTLTNIFFINDEKSKFRKNVLIS